MALQSLLNSNDPNTKLVEALCTSLRRRQLVGSRNVALATAHLIHTIVRGIRFSTLDELLVIIKLIGRQLNEANPKELASGNIIRRILRLFREEYRAAAATHISTPPTPLSGPETPGLHAPSTHYLSNDLSFQTASPPRRPSPHATPSMNTVNLPRAPSLSNFVAMRHSRAQLERSGSSVSELSYNNSSLSLTAMRDLSMGMISEQGWNQYQNEEFMRQSAKLRPVLVQAVEEVIGELETTHEDVAKGAKEHIHSSEIILTLGHSKTVETFLRHAYRDRKFTVIVAESAPSFSGHAMATALSSANIPTLLVPDSSIHALMPRITKVIFGAHTILANGGSFALSGTLATALAAKAHSKPVVVTTGQFKFAPVWNLFHEYGAVDFKSPGEIMNGAGDVLEGVDALVPEFEYIRPDLINLFVTNEGDHSPSYIYRIIKDVYDDEDVEL